MLEALAKVVGPPSLVTALAFFFGWTFTNARFRYFGVDLSTLDLSTADYVLHSVTALFGPMVVLLLLVLLAVGVDGLVSAAVRTRRGARLVRHGARAVLAAGIAITLAGAAQIYWPMPVRLYFLLPPALLGLGATSAYFALWTLQQLRRSGDPSCGDPPSGPTPPPRWLTWGRPPVVLLVVLSAFWTASTYADALGRGRAQQLAQNLWQLPNVTVVSRQPLGLDEPGVSGERVTPADSLYHYRYVGLYLLIRSRSKYFLLPQDWTPDDGAVVVIDDNADIRVEFGTGG